MRIAKLRKRLATGGIPAFLILASLAFAPAAAQANVAEGNPQLYSNGSKVEAESKAVAVLGYGDVELKSEQLPGGFVECTSVGIGSGFNTGSPSRGKGKILSYMAAGHAPASTHKELSAECRGLGGKAWATDEKPIKPESALNAKRGELTVPWNVEGICRINESEETTTIVIVGVPTTLTTAEKEAREKRKCVEAAAEPTEITNEISKKEGCYASNPSPEGCIGVLVDAPEISLELNYGGSLRAVAKNGAGSGLNQSTWTFKGASSGELQCQSLGCTAKGITTGVVKQQGFESAQLLTYK
jgi:hypothetical protein